MSSPKESVHKFYTEDLKVRAAVAITTNTVRTIKQIQGAYPLATLGLGRLLTGTALMASYLNDGQSLSVRISGSGILGEVIAEASYEGEVRAYCPNPHADLRTDDGRLNLKEAIGPGVLTVARTMPFQKEPHVGIVPIQTGEISQDLAYYLLQSQQIPSVVALAVAMDSQGEILAAGGILLEAMPGADEAIIHDLEKRSKTAPSLAESLKAGHSHLDLLKPYVHNSKIILAAEGGELKYACRCNNERVERTLLLLGKAELSEMILKGKKTEMRCEFCGKKYSIPVERLRQLHQGLTQPD